MYKSKTNQEKLAKVQKNLEAEINQFIVRTHPLYVTMNWEWRVPNKAKTEIPTQQRLKEMVEDLVKRTFVAFEQHGFKRCSISSGGIKVTIYNNEEEGYSASIKFIATSVIANEWS